VANVTKKRVSSHRAVKKRATKKHAIGKTAIKKALRTIIKKIGKKAALKKGMKKAAKKYSSSTCGFASMSPEKQRAIARKGSESAPHEKRSFSHNPRLAAEAGRRQAASRLQASGRKSPRPPGPPDVD
jgi:general stress protein YciG